MIRTANDVIDFLVDKLSEHQIPRKEIVLIVLELWGNMPPCINNGYAIDTTLAPRTIEDVKEGLSE